MGAVTPTDKDIEEMELNPDQPSPNDQYLMAEAKRAESEAQKMQAETQETMSNSKLKEAQAMQIMQELQTPVQENVQEPKEPTFKEEEIITKAFVEKAKLDLQERELELREREIELRYSQDIKDKDIVKDGSDVK
jgi:predicted HTH domain antitoxin